MANSLENLKAMKAKLECIYEYLPRFGLFTDRPPILDILEPPPLRESALEDGKKGDIQVLSEEGSPGNSGLPGSKTQGDMLRHPHASIPGLRVFRENFLSRQTAKDANMNTSTLSTNAPYLIAVWNELTRASPPLMSVGKAFDTRPAELNAQSAPEKSSKTNVGVKVDVVSDNGRRWIRVNTVKNSRLLAEFREADSYLTESEDEDDSCESADRARPGTAQRVPEELDNSLLQMGRALVLAAQSNPLIGVGQQSTPIVNLHLTRLLLDATSLIELQGLGLKVVGLPQCCVASDDSGNDPRISQTVRKLLEMGIKIELGEHEFQIPPDLLSTVRPLPRLSPSRKINLDLSVLIALVSDLTHAALPASASEASTRFIPTPAEKARSRMRKQRQKELLARAKSKRGGSTNISGPAKEEETACADGSGADGAEDEGNGDGDNVHCRALLNQLGKEMELGLLEEILGRLQTSGVENTASAVVPIEFWTSSEVRDRCLRIVEKIGGPTERRRTSALFFRGSAYTHLGTTYSSAEEASDAFWRGSRHRQNFIPGLVPLRILDEDDKPNGSIERRDDPCPNPFWEELECACRRLISEGVISHPRSLS
ncbi:hypothetical protein M0805_004065, partial [Coniferiporia weirii]